MKDLAVSLVATITIQLLTMVQGVLSARWLLPEGKGELTAAMLWPTLIAALGSLGIGDALVFATANGDIASTKRSFASALWLMIAMSFVLFAAGYVVLPVVLSKQSPSLIRTSQLFLFYIPPALVTPCLIGVLLGKLRLTLVNILRVSVYVIVLSLMVIFFILDRVSVQNFALAFLVASWCVLLLAWVFASQRSLIGGEPSLTAVKELITYGIKVHIGSLAGTLNLRLDQLLLSVFLPLSALGLYVVAVTVASGANLITTTVANWVVFPRLSNLPAGFLKTQTLGRFMRFAILMTLFSVVILFVGAPWLITIFFGIAYGESVSMARILILAAIPLGCNAIFTAGFKSSNLPTVSSRAEIIGLGATSLALVVLLPNFQALGAAWASLLAYSATFIYMLIQSRRKMGVRLGKLFLPSWDDWHYLKGLLVRTSHSRFEM